MGMKQEIKVKTDYVGLAKKCHAKNIIFDLGGVLFEPTSDFTKKEYGEKFNYMQELWVFFKKCEQINPDTRFNNKGLPLPLLVCKTWTGKITNEEALKETIKLINEHETDKKQKAKLRWSAHITFTSKLFVEKSLRPIQQGIDLLGEFLKKDYKVYLFTNLDVETLQELQKQYPIYFNIFNDLVSSANLKFMKPLKESFTAMLEHFNIKAEESFFIDDQQENIDSARLCGINGALFTK